MLLTYQTTKKKKIVGSGIILRCLAKRQPGPLFPLLWFDCDRAWRNSNVLSLHTSAL